MTTKQIRVQEVADFLLDGTKTREEAVAHFCTKLHTSRRTIQTYVTEAQKINKKRLDKANKKTEDMLVKEKEKALKKQLKTKTEKMVHLQDQINDMQTELKNGTKTISGVYEGVAYEREVPLTPNEKAYLRRTIKDLYTELNKMSGDYEAEKQEHLHKGSLGWIPQRKKDE